MRGSKVNLSSFDTTDLRFLDADGAVGSLKRKGSQKKTRLDELGKFNFFADPITIRAAA